MRTAAVVISLLVASTAGWAQKDYSLRDPEPRLGTRIRDKAVQGFRFPLDKRYDQFTPEEREALKSNYEAMPDADEPPFPKDGLRVYMLDIREAARKREAQGALVLLAVVDKSGKVEKVDIYEAPDMQLAKYAAVKLGRLSFKPAVCAGAPCQMEFLLSVKFVLELR